MIDRERDRELMRMAVDLSRRSEAEPDGRVHPFVGAVIAHPNGEVISSGYRGQYVRGNHAEQEALIGLRPDVVAGCVVYSTLEPCVYRGKQTPCCLRLIDRNVSEVVIGILDPNPDIRGKGWWDFEKRGIRVRNFDHDFVQEIRQMNAAFIDDQLGPGIVITEIQPEGFPPAAVSEYHRARREIVEVRHPKNVIRGTYRHRPPDGHRIRLFVRRGITYYPQAPINFRYDLDNSRWECPTAWILDSPEGTDNEIVIANLSEDLMVATRHYSDVHRALGNQVGVAAWVGIQMEPPPPGFQVLANVTVNARQ